MAMEQSGTEKKRNIRLLLLILALGLFTRSWLFGAVPGDINQDEAFAGYEAWSLLTTGADTAGYRFPVYLTAWGSGMNALESYLMLPFIALFGLKVWVIRLPQLLVGLFSIWVLYLTARRMLGERAGLFATFLLAVCPWHVLLSRWGLESNLAPGFLLFGLYFFLRGLENSRLFLLSALFYGLSLYAYATIWPFVPLLIGLQLVYCALCGQLKADRYLLFSGAVLGALALPLLLFLAVNFGLMEEIRTPVLSVPRLLYMRSEEISFRNIPENLKNLLSILLRQSDGLPWNSAGRFGLLYPISMPFALLGLAIALRQVIRARRGYRPEMLLLMNLLAGLLLGALIRVNVNRVNIIFLPLVMLAALGLSWLDGKAGNRVLPAAAAVYTAFFVCFVGYYFTDYRQEIRSSFSFGLEAAIETAEAEEGPIYVSERILYPCVLLFSQTPAEEFRETVRYRNYPAAFLQVASFGRYVFLYEEAAPEPGAVYILDNWSDLAAFLNAGFELKQIGYYKVATWP